jgi:predicted DCC family thiol-disulfide oxidoreductase YuxK
VTTDTRSNESSKLEAAAEPRPAPGAENANPSPDAAAHPIVFFDGVCGFCNRVVDFAIRRDRGAKLRFAPLQGETARRMLSAADVENLSTFVFYDEGSAYRRSSAVARMLWRIGGVWRVAGALLWIIPKPLRDLGYRLVAKYRYALFGKKETCRMPSPAERERFLP